MQFKEIIAVYSENHATSEVVPLHVMKALGGRGSILLLILDLCTRWG
jgi:hypothetical protein